MVIPMIQVGNVIVSPDVFTECFCCDLEACGGACCVEGESGAPLLEEEIAQIEDIVKRKTGFKASQIRISTLKK